MNNRCEIEVFLDPEVMEVELNIHSSFNAVCCFCFKQ